MASYRMICLKRPAMKSIRQKQIVNQLLVLESIVTVFFLGIFVGGRSAVGHPDRWMSFCKGHSAVRKWNKSSWKPQESLYGESHLE